MTDENITYYRIKLNGVFLEHAQHQWYTSRMAAEMAKNNLPDSMRMEAEIVPVASDGREILLG